MKLNTCSISFKTKFQTRFNTKFSSSPIHYYTVFWFFYFVLVLQVLAFFFQQLRVREQHAISRNYGTFISLYLIAGQERKTLTVSELPPLKQFIYQKSSLFYTSNTYLKPISSANYQTITENNLYLLCITASGCEIQFVFSSEDEVFGSYLKDGWWLQGSSYCKQCKLR